MTTANLDAFRAALKVLCGTGLSVDGKAFMDVVSEVLEQRDQLFAALEAAYAYHRANECPTDTTQQDHNWRNHKGIECTCTAFDPVRAALKKAGAK